jgi:F-box and WD-40 domain protein 1/11
MSAELVSHAWHDSASSHVWRDVFRAEFQAVYHTIATPSAGPPGLGRARGQQDWKNMWRVRKALHQRWLDGHAAAIYLEGHTDSVYCVQFDKDKIITGSRDRTVRIWDAHTYECIKVIGVTSRNPGSAVPPLPEELADQGHRPFTTVFSPQSDIKPAAAVPYLYHTESILCLQYDDEIMVTGSSDHTLIIWDVKADYQPIRQLRHHTAGVLDVCFDEKHIISCSKDATVCLWDRQTGFFLRKLSGHRGPVNAVQLRGDLVVSASGDGIAKLWNLTSGLCIKEFPSKDRGMACVEFSPDARTILAGGNDQVIYQFDTNTGELVREMRGHEGLVRSLHLDSASGRVVSGSYDTSVKAYDLKNGDNIVNFTKWTTSWILSAKADYRRIIATSQDGRAVIMDFGYQLPGVESLDA